MQSGIGYLLVLGGPYHSPTLNCRGARSLAYGHLEVTMAKTPLKNLGGWEAENAIPAASRSV
jgi:hypothetical protein